MFRRECRGWNTKGEYVENNKGMHDSMVVVFDGFYGGALKVSAMERE